MAERVRIRTAGRQVLFWIGVCRACTRKGGAVYEIGVRTIRKEETLGRREAAGWDGNPHVYSYVVGHTGGRAWSRVWWQKARLLSYQRCSELGVGGTLRWEKEFRYHLAGHLNDDHPLCRMVVLVD